MDNKNLDTEAQRLYNDSPIEVQKQFDELQEIKKQARELADIFGSIAVDEALTPSNLSVTVEVLEMAADLLKADCKQIRQAAVDIAEEEKLRNR